MDGWHLADSPATIASPDAAARPHPDAGLDADLEPGTHRTAPEPALGTQWRGTRGPLFRLTLWTGLLTILTLGLYRFWARTRVRRWYWSAIRPGGFPLEYTGTPYEKLLGFLVAVVILAFYIGVVNLVLMFVSFSLLSAPGLAYGLTLLGVAPLWFFATYRAQRYLLARTRWMGIRFGLEPGAWRYALLASWHWGLTLLTLGAWHPRLRFALARYRHDRMWFGTQKLSQGGDWRMLYPAYAHVLIGGTLTLGTLFITVADVNAFLLGLEAEDLGQVAPVTPFWQMFGIGIPWLLYGLVHYSVESRRLLVSHLSVGAVGLMPRPRVSWVLWIAISGNLLRYAALFTLILAAALALIGLALAAGATLEQLEGDDPMALMRIIGSGLPDWVPVAATALFYFGIFLLWNVLTHVFLTMPTWRHYAATLGITGPGKISSIAQRARDESREAGGFAEALDVGAAI
ncbi:MAG: DUF898 family protein [Pseudomonadota bacterium]